MRRGAPDGRVLLQSRVVAPAEFALQMFPLVKQLPARLGQAAAGFRPGNLRSIEPVAASHGFGADFTQVAGDGGDRVVGGAEARELRMMPVAFGFSAQNFLRQQTFAPKRDEAAGVEIFRMQCPEAHSALKGYRKFAGKRTPK